MFTRKRSKQNSEKSHKTDLKPQKKTDLMKNNPKKINTSREKWISEIKSSQTKQNERSTKTIECINIDDEEREKQKHETKQLTNCVN
jgi:hypothetical protein